MLLIESVLTDESIITYIFIEIRKIIIYILIPPLVIIELSELSVGKE